MKKKNRPAKNSAPVQPAPTPPPKQPVLQGDCFVTFVREAQSLGNEVEFRRVFDADVGEYLVAKNLAADFNAWREAKHAKP